MSRTRPSRRAASNVVAFLAALTSHEAAGGLGRRPGRAGGVGRLRPAYAVEGLAARVLSLMF
jgi:hypothetical protein